MARIKIFKHGRHAHRTPLSYPALAPLFTDRIELVDRPDLADLHVFAHSLDVEAAPRALVEDWRRRRRPIVILSEEPFWDTLWGRRPLTRDRVIDSDHGALPVIQLNHHTSEIFRFARIPYYLLTNHRFANTYAARFTRNARLGPADWQARFAERPVGLTFMFERRPDPMHNLRWPEGGIIGLCAWRTALAETCSADDSVPGGPLSSIERLGASWQGGPSRFALDDWYLDKMARLDDHSRLLAAFENTHQPNYITEKVFDAFACGALPLYFAAPDHRFHDFGLPAEAWVNLYDLPVPDAARRLARLRLTSDVFDAYAEAQQSLKALFDDAGLWMDERRRLGAAVVRELTEVLDAAGSAAPDPIAGAVA